MANTIKQNIPVASSVSTSIGFAMMCVGMFMAILDVQVVATSLPTIQSALDIPPDQMSWVQTAYLIAEVIAIPLTGFLTRLLSMCWLFVLAISVFNQCSDCYHFGGICRLPVAKGADALERGPHARFAVVGLVGDCARRAGNSPQRSADARLELRLRNGSSGA